jgi:hypothetical protein
MRDTWEEDGKEDDFIKRFRCCDCLRKINIKFDCFPPGESINFFFKKVIASTKSSRKLYHEKKEAFEV